MNWVINPKTQRPIKVGSRFYKFIKKSHEFSEIDYIRPHCTPPNNDITSKEFEKWVMHLYEYYQNKKPKKPRIEIINLSTI